MHYKKLFPTGFIDEGDLPKDVTATIAQVTREQVPIPGKDIKKPCHCGAVYENDEPVSYGDCHAMKVVASFQGAKKRLVLNKTNAVRISKLYGNNTESWAGKAITLYFDPTIKFGRDTVGGVRVREKKPA